MWCACPAGQDAGGPAGLTDLVQLQTVCALLLSIVCVVMWGGRSFGLHTSKVRAKDRGHTYSLHRTHMGCLTWTVRAHVL
jgi:hypothetical protein